MRVAFISIFFGIVIALLSCKKDKVQTSVISPDQCPDTISYANVIEPLMDQSCATTGCHDNGSSAAGFAFTTHQNVSVFADQALGAMRHDGGFNPMPLGGQKLADSLIQKFECWIAQGKLNN